MDIADRIPLGGTLRTRVPSGALRNMALAAGLAAILTAAEAYNGTLTRTLRSIRRRGHLLFLLPMGPHCAALQKPMRPVKLATVLAIVGPRDSSLPAYTHWHLVAFLQCRKAGALCSA